MKKPLRFSLFCTLISLATVTVRAVPIEVTYTDSPGTGFFSPDARAPVGGNNGTTLGVQRRIAFEYAAKRWSEQISGTIPIKIRASYSLVSPAGEPPVAPYLASARPQDYLANSGPSGPLPLGDTLYPTALANQLANEDTIIGGTGNDIIVTCNSYYESNGTRAGDPRRWYYGLDSNPPVVVVSPTFTAPWFDFVGTTLHEIGHGLGFSSHLATDGSYIFGKPSVWNRLMSNGAGTAVPALSQTDRAAAMTSNAVYVTSPKVLLYNNGNGGRVFAPNPFQSGSSMSHFDETTYSAPGSINELMTPTDSFATQNFGPLCINSLRDMGYVMLDSLPPTVGINVPVPGRSYRSTALAISGSAKDTSSQGASNAVGLLRVKIALSNSGGQWFTWSVGGGGSFTGTIFDHGTHVKEATVQGIVPIPTGNKAWTASLPTGLADGTYQLHVAAVDQLDQGTEFIASSFTIDNAAPATQIEPWVNNAQVFNLEGFKVFAPGAQTVEVEIRRLDGPTTWYWSGTNWATTPFTLATTASGDRWQVAAALPPRNTWPAGQPVVLFARATDAATNTSTAQIQVTRTAVDTSAPVLSFSSPVSGVVLSQRSLPSIAGNAKDLESGIASLTLTIAHFLPGGGVDFWNGAGWGAASVDLPVQHDPVSGDWSAPFNWNLPGGPLLPNGGYSLQLTATNRELPAATIGLGRGFSVNFHQLYTWTGETMRDLDSGNNSSSWGTPENWSPYGVPGSGDIAVIDNGDTVTSDTSRTVHALGLHGGNLHFLNGPGASGTVTTTDASEWSSGSLYGIWEVPAAATLTLSGTVTRELSTLSQIRNSGTVTWTGGTTQGHDTATVTNLPGGVWILAAGGDAFDNYYANNQFINQGILRQSSGANVVFNDWIYTLGGQIQRQGGALLLEAAVTVPGGTQFTHAGSLRMLSGSLTASGTISNAGGLFEIAGGTTTAASPVTLGGAYLWSGGAWSGNFTVPAGSDLSITGDCRLNTSAVLNNAGTVHWNSPLPLNGFDTVTVNNLASGVWRLEAGGNAFSNYYSNNTFNNFGLLEKTAAGQTDLRDWSYALPGHTKIGAGILRIEATSACPAGALLSGPGTLDIGAGTFSLGGEIASTVANLKFSGGWMTCAAGAKIQGDWSWTGGIVNGSLEVPLSRKLTLNGSLMLWASSTLVNRGHVLWQGPNPLVGYENVTVTNMPGATWELAAAGSAFGNQYSGNHFHNQGLLTRTAPTGDVILSAWTFHQSGVMNATAGSTQFHSTLNLLAGGSFTGAGAFSFHTDTVLKGPTTFTASAEVAGGGFIGEAAGSVNGTLRWSGGVFSGSTKVALGAFLRISGTASKLLWAYSDLDVAGEMIWEEGDLTGYELSRFIIRSGAFLRVQGSGSLINHYTGNHVVIEDGASFVKTNSGDNVINWAFDNNGSATVNAGKLILNGGGISDGGFSANSGGVLSFASGTQALQTGATLAGGIECNGGTLLAEGNASARIDVKSGSVGSTAPAVLTFSGACTWTNGVLSGIIRIPAGTSLAVSGPDYKLLWAYSTLVDEGSIEWSGGAPIQGYENSTIDVRSGAIFRLSSDGDVFSNYHTGNRLLVSGTLEKTTGLVSTVIDEWLVEGNGTFRPVTARIDLLTNVNLLSGARFEGAGRTRFGSSTTTVQGTSTILPGSTIELAGTTLTGNGDGTAAFAGGAIEWSSGWINGIVQFGSTTTVSGSDQKFIGAGSEVRNSGTMTLTGTGLFTGYYVSTLRNLAGGTLTCTGSAHLGNYSTGNRLINEGTLAIGGPLGRQTMDWAFEQTPTGTLAIGVSGENAAIPEFDILHSTGGIQLAGKLQATKNPGYVPAEDTTFAIITGSAISGTFTTVQAPGFSLEYAPGSATLRAGNSGTGYEEWTVLNALAGANALAEADPDHDGVENFLEYAFNTDPKLHTAAPVTSSVINLAGQNWITLHYRSWQDRIDAGLGYYPERSANLAGWNPSGVVDEADPAAPAIAGSEARRCRILLGIDKQFLRMRVE